MSTRPPNSMSRFRISCCMHVGLGLERVKCVLCDMLRSPRRMTLRFLRWREATKSMSSSHSVRAAEDVGSGFHVCADDRGAAEGCAYVKGVPAFVEVVGWFAYSSVKPTLVEECNNSPAFSMVAAV